MKGHRSLLSSFDPQISNALAGEERRQKFGVELIPSENYTYPEVLEILGTVLTNKYSEGYPGRRYYGGQEFTDEIETLACKRAIEVFRGEHANVQPLSGSAMNQAVYLGLLKPGDTILAMELSHGGHLTHGAPVSHMGMLFNFIRYKTRDDGSLDYAEIEQLAKQHQPKMVLCGYSSYPRDLDYAAFKSIADSVGALTMADISHFGGLVAGNAMANPLDYGFDVITTTTHKSLRGPRAGLIVCREPFAKAIDQSVFPGLQGGPHMNVIAATAVTLLKAKSDEFKQHCLQVLNNAQALSKQLIQRGAVLVSGGTDNHLVVVNTIDSYGIDGQQAQRVLDQISITTNKQVVPDEPLTPARPSGIRLGTPAATTRGMNEQHMVQLANWICDALENAENKSILANLNKTIEHFCSSFVLPGVD
jgi:glycine hydroxymethyltransferase